MRKLPALSLAAIAAIIITICPQYAYSASFNAYNIDPLSLAKSFSRGAAIHEIRYAASELLRDTDYTEYADRIIRPDEFKESKHAAAVINGMSNVVGDLARNHCGTGWDVFAETLFFTVFDYVNDPGQDKTELAKKNGHKFCYYASRPSFRYS